MKSTPGWVKKAVEAGKGTALDLHNTLDHVLTDDLLISLLHDSLTELNLTCVVRHLFADVSLIFIVIHVSSEIRSRCCCTNTGGDTRLCGVVVWMTAHVGSLACASFFRTLTDVSITTVAAVWDILFSRVVV